MKKVAIIGASGFVGQNLINEILLKTDYSIVAVAPNIEKIEIENTRLKKVSASIFDKEKLLQSLSGVDVVFYLVHMMNTKEKHFYDMESKSANTFGFICKEAGIQKVVYLSGLGRENDSLSEHLASRHNTGKIIRQYCPLVTEFRASMIIGKGSISFEIVKNLVEKLPIIILPKKAKTLTQPIGLSDVMRYLVSAIDLEISQSEIVEIGGPRAMSYEDFIKMYAKWLGKKVKIVTFSLLPEWIAGSWLYLVTSREKARVGRHMVQSFQNEMVVTNNKALDLFPNIYPKPVEEFFDK